jgi:predicted nucleic acid-binding protein
MTNYFVDSSALAKRYRVEPGSIRLSALLRTADQIFISRLTVIEVSAALVRRARQAKAPEDLKIALDLLDFEVGNTFDVLELDEPVPTHALAATRQYGLRGADAIQFAAAIVARRRKSNQVTFVSCDDELNAAAAAEGWQVENPNLHP